MHIPPHCLDSFTGKRFARGNACGLPDLAELSLPKEGLQPVIILLALQECHSLGCLRVLKHIRVCLSGLQAHKTSSPGNCARVLFSNDVATSYPPR